MTNEKLPIGTKMALEASGCGETSRVDFLKEYREFLVYTIDKAQERCPLNCRMAVCCSSLNPWNMANEQEASILLFDSLCDEMFKQQRLSNSDHEDAMSQYSTFLKTVVSKNEDEFSNFDYTKDRLDKFLGKFLIGAVKYCILWEVCKFVFILSHGQASIERGFNVNKVETENVITSMRKDIDEIPRKAVLKETFKEMKLDLEKANSFRDAVKAKEVLVTEFDQALLQLEKEMKKQQ